MQFLQTVSFLLLATSSLDCLHTFSPFEYSILKVDLMLQAKGGEIMGAAYGGGFALIVVLFILLVIIGASYVGY